MAEYAYLYEKAAFREQLTDKIGDAVYAGNGRFYIVERDDSVQRSGKKMLFEFTLNGATNLRAPGAPPLLAGQSLEQHTPDELVDVTDDDRIVLTTRGRLLSNELFSRLV